MPTFTLAICGYPEILSWNCRAAVRELLNCQAADILSVGRDLELRLPDDSGIGAIALDWARDADIPYRIYFDCRQRLEAAEIKGVEGELVADVDSDGATLAECKLWAAILYGRPPELPRVDRLLVINSSWKLDTGWQQLGCIRQAELMQIEVEYEEVEEF